MIPRDRWLTATGAALVAAAVAVAALSDLNHRLPLFFALFAAMFVLYAAAVARVRGAGNATDARQLVWIVGVAVAARLVLVPAAPVMSTDIYRYLWEGRVVAHGMNPFALAPDAPALEDLRDDDPAAYAGINHKHMETIYPPLAQAVFALGATAHRSLWMQKLLFILFDAATVVVLIRLLRLRGVDPRMALVYAWNPLVVFETGHSGHLDAVGIFFMVLGLWLLLRTRTGWATLSLAASFLAKFVAVLLAPFFLVRRRLALWLLVAAAVVVVAYLPFAGAGSKLFASLSTYSTEWRFNALAYHLLSAVWHDPLWARRSLVAALAVVVWVRAFRDDDVLRYLYVCVGCALLAVPTLYPWYLAWIVPFLCVFPNRAWLLFTGLVTASYTVWTTVDRTGVWEVTPLVYAIEYAPFLALLAVDAWRGRRRRGGEVAV